MTAYDVALANYQEYFSQRIAELCAENNLTFFLIESIWAKEFLEKLQKGDVSVGVLLDMQSDPYDKTNIYYRIAREVKANGGLVIDDPDKSPVATHKGKFHVVLEKNGVPVPETVFVARDKIDSFKVDAALKKKLGVPFVVKPSWGSGGQGVILNGRSTADIARSAEQSPESDSFMLQNKIVPKMLEGHPAWFRIYYVCGEIIPCWWHPSTGDYALVSPLQRRKYQLTATEQIVFNIAKLSQMEFFSTEVALTEDGKFIAIDYLNDECDMSPKSYYPSGPPDEVVRRIAMLMVNKAMKVLRKHPFENDLLQRDANWQEYTLHQAELRAALAKQPDKP